MNKEQINIAIAEYCGFECRKDFVDNFSNDLNAMLSAEECLEDDQHAFSCYNVELLEKFGYTVSISAADRAEMFVKVIGRWEGEE